jgi:hypothetical protein
VSGTPAEPRQLSGVLLIGTLAVPLVFVWFFLRRGYTPSLRKAAFTWAIALTGLNAVGRIFGGP